MKLVIALCVLFVGAYCVPVLDEQLNSNWDLFKRVYGKQYNSVEDEANRRSIWEANLAKIHKHNLEADLGMHTYTLGMNRFGDMTHEEFKKQMNGLKMSTTTDTTEFDRHTFLAPSNIAIPDAVDWRKQGYVTPVKDQGQCGSCWAFSATGSLEGQHFAQAKKLVSLSEQNLVDCSGKFGNLGCDGGLMDQAFQYIKANKGIDTEESYPYEARDGKCRFKKAHIGATDTGFTDIKPKNETDLQVAIATIGPISVAIDASQDSFQFYKKGVYNEPDCSSTELDHGVLAVGYDKDGSKEYYIVKNSWGTSWGQEGYIWMSRNKKNQCGIATMASYPLV
jgi:cathepsin L